MKNTVSQRVPAKVVKIESTAKIMQGLREKRVGIYMIVRLVRKFCLLFSLYKRTSLWKGKIFNVSVCFLPSSAMENSHPGN